MDRNRSIREIMTTELETVSVGTPVREVAQIMSRADVGALIVRGPERAVHGIVTDRDITIRATAEGLDPETTLVEEVCTTSPVCLSPSDTIEQAIRSMVDASVRRIPVTDNGLPVGILSLGDLAVAQQPDSALGAISAASAQA